jgi:hypothetical protein
MSSNMADSSPSLTDTQRHLLRNALRSGESAGLTSAQRQTIREIRIALGHRAKKPEQLLVAFKSALNDVANEAKLPLGQERSALMDRFVSAFIEELYKPDGKITTRMDGESKESGPIAFTPAETPGLSDAHP